MGSGKTTIGKQLAKSMHFEFYDSDDEIERTTGASISWIFDIEGEAGFRHHETKAIASLTQLSKIVLATGGGAVLSADNRCLLASHGYVIYLKAKPTTLLERTAYSDKRPLLAQDDKLAKINHIIQQREALYQEIADYTIVTDQSPIQRTITLILEHLDTL